MEDVELHELLELYRHVGELVCKEMGHDWREQSMPGGEVSTMNAPSCERCERCHETRLVSPFSNTTTSVSIND